VTSIGDVSKDETQFLTDPDGPIQDGSKLGDVASYKGHKPNDVPKRFPAYRVC
jgi:hypothetical protein